MNDQRVDAGTSIVHRDGVAIEISDMIKRKWAEKKNKSLAGLVRSIERTAHICGA